METSNHEATVRRISVLKDQLAICRLEPDQQIPGWAADWGFSAVTRTADELSVVCPERNVPERARCEPGWRALKLEGPFEFTEIGVLASVAEPLASAGVSIFAVSTYDTDYVLVREDHLDSAVAALRNQGHEIVKS